MARQLTFDLTARPALGRDNYYVSPSNALAVSAVDDWLNWPQGKLVLYGPEAAGKSHLTQVWAGDTGAEVLAATDLAGRDIAALASGCVAVEDVPQIAGDAPAQAALFHLYNLIGAQGGHLLMTGRDAPSRWPIDLPDLHSRLNAIQTARIDPPDDTLLTAVLVKLFADRQIAPRPDVIPYLVTQMSRSFADAARIVEELDAAGLAQQRSLTRPFVARALGLGRQNR